VISAIGPAKWKTGFQSVWVGSAYFWFFAATLAASRSWQNSAWTSFAYFNGIVGTVTMTAAVFLTIYSLALYMMRYSKVFAR
jgi:CDP-diacylglycerol---glycerol-3-phosphate 3-phosphatidyltransferase